MAFIDENFNESKDYETIKTTFKDEGVNAQTINYLTERAFEDDAWELLKLTRL